jgi:UDP-N-acetylglucosamine:LPS N-acetylglucosamine transferase
MGAFEGHEVFFVTYDSPRTRTIKYEKYLLKNIGTNPFKMVVAFLDFFRIFINERPKVIISTGSEIAIPAFYIAKIFGIKTIYIESWCRIEVPSGTGKLIYPVSNIFLVQWPQLLNKYGSKARFEGAII